MATYQGLTPGATQFGMFQAQANQAYQDALTRIQGQRSDLLRQAGLEGVYDENGNLTGQHVAAGPGSEFGAYQQLHGAMAQQGEQTDAAAAGLGFGGGLAQQLRDLGQHDAEAQSLNFGQGVLSGLSGLGQQQQGALADRNSSVLGQFLENIRAGVDSGAFNPADYGGLGPGYDPYAPATDAWKPPKPRKNRRNR